MTHRLHNNNIALLLAFLFAGFLTFVHPVQTPGQQGEVSVESRLNKSVVTIGEQVLYEVIVRHKREIDVTMPPQGINLGGFEIRAFNEIDPVTIDGLVERKVEYVIAAYDTGTYFIPPTGVLYMTSDSVQNVLLTDAVAIRVVSILTGDMEDIIDIKDPLELLFNWNTIILLSVIGFVVIVLGVLGYLYYRQKKRGKPLFEWKKVPDVPAHIEALESLKALSESSLLADGKVKEYYVLLSDILRLYLQKRYFKPFLEMTTTQTIAVLTEESLEEGILPKIELLLDDCDIVKFAKFLPAEEDHKSSLQTAYDIVEQTKIESLLSEENSDHEKKEETAGELDEVIEGETGEREFDRNE